MNTKKQKVSRLAVILLTAALAIAGTFVTANAASKGKLNKSKASVTVWNTVKLKVSGTSSKVSWSTSNKKIATVKKSGKYGAVVKGKKNGKVTITAKVGSRRLKCRVTVKAGLNKTTVSVKKGKSAILQMRGTKRSVKWYTSNKNIVTVKKAGQYKVKITGKKTGAATVTAKVGTKKFKCRVVVNTGLNKTSVTLKKGSSTTLQMVGTKRSVKWYTSNKNIVTVKKTSRYNAKISGKKTGTATVTAKVGAKSFKCRVRVKADSAKVKVSKTIKMGEILLGVGSKTTITFPGGKRVGRWFSDNKNFSFKIKGASSVEITAKERGIGAMDASFGDPNLTYRWIITVVSKDVATKINNAVKSLIKPGMSDQEKAYKLALYVCDKLDHHYGKGYGGDIYSREECIAKGEAWNTGYNNLYRALLSKVGIKSTDVGENVGGYRTKVQIEGKWYNVDTYHMDVTGAKSGERGLNYDFFLFSDKKAFKDFSNYYYPCKYKWAPDATSTRFDDLKYGTKKKIIVPAREWTHTEQTGTVVKYMTRIPKGNSWSDGYDFVEISKVEFEKAQLLAGTTEDNFTLNTIHYSKSETPIYTEIKETIPAVTETVINYKDNIWTRGEYF